jgi:hypothetical protein
MTARSCWTLRPTGRSLHLDHHLGPVAQPGPVHLGDGRCSERFVIDGGEHLLGWTAELLDDHPVNDGPWLGWYRIPTPLELRNELRREYSVARSHNLPELDVGSGPGAPPRRGGVARSRPSSSTLPVAAR